MRIIKEAAVKRWCQQWPEAKPSLERWLKLVQHRNYRHFADLRTEFPSADLVHVASGKSAVVFNIAGNKFRLITALHYNSGNCFVMMFLTHAQYDTQQWRREL